MFCNGRHFTCINTSLLIMAAHHSAHKGRARPMQPASTKLRKELLHADPGPVTRAHRAAGDVRQQHQLAAPLSTPELYSRTDTSEQELAKGLTSHQHLPSKHPWNHQTLVHRGDFSSVHDCIEDRELLWCPLLEVGGTLYS